MTDPQADALSFLRKESLDIYNRLHSISEDIAFVTEVHEAFPTTPILPNLRCGAWYTDPSIATASPAYFKSTDGHFSNWSFNLRRPNLHLLRLVEECQGFILVDSTRSGKRIPDALSKTVPIWCAVINRAILLRFPELSSTNSGKWDVCLYTPPKAVSVQEHDQIERLLDGWADALSNSSYALPKLQKPLRPFWITPATSVFPNLSSSTNEFIPIICLSASKHVAEGVERRSGGYAYVQGSGDDHELWGMGLTPSVFWENKELLMNATRSELSELVKDVVGRARTTDSQPPTPVNKVDGRIILCAVEDLKALWPSSSEDKSVYIIITGDTFDLPITGDASRILHISCNVDGKKGQGHFLQEILPRSDDFIRVSLAKGKRVWISCDTGKDVSVGVALVALQKYFDDDGKYNQRTVGSTDKQTIRTRLEWIISSRPQANPSRTTLKRVNNYLLSSSFVP